MVSYYIDKSIQIPKEIYLLEALQQVLVPQLELLCSLRQQLKHVLLVDEICDSGRTLASLKLLISQRNAASVKTCVLLDKVSRRQADIRPDYVGAVCPDEFVVGYGMDWGGKLRSLPFVGVVRRELYES